MSKSELMGKQLKIDKSAWALTKLGDLAEEYSDRVDNPSKSKYDRFVGLEHFVSGDLKIANWGSTENLGSSMKAFRAGDILFARRNAYLRRASLVDFDGCCSGDALVIRKNHEKVVPGYLAFLMNSNALWDYANSNAAGTMSKRVKWRDLAEYEFLLPPKEQQAQLAELLWAMDEVIEKEKKILEKLELAKICHINNVYKLLVQNEKLTKLNIAELASPEKYSCVGGPFGSNLTSKDYVDSGGVPVIRGVNLTGKETSFSEENFVFVSQEKAKELCRNLAFREDIIVTQRGTLGQVALIPSNSKYKEYIVSQSQMKITVNRQLVNPLFLYYYLLSAKAQNHIKKVTITTGIPHINLEIFKKVPVLIPVLSKQQKIVNELSQFDHTRKLVDSKIDHSKALQKSLINQIF